MLKKLRRKFILINMMLVSLVLLIVFAVLLGSTSQRLRGQSISAMRLALKWGESMDPPQIEIALPEGEEPDGGEPEARQLARVPVFGVVLDEEGKIDSYSPGGNMQVSQEALEQAVEECGSRACLKGPLPSQAICAIWRSGTGTERSALPLPICAGSGKTGWIW